MPVIPVAHLPAPVRQALRRGLVRRTTRLVPCRGLDEIQDLLRHELVDAVVVNADLTAPERVFRLSSRYPRIPFFAWGGFRPDAGALVAACHRAGLADVFVADVARALRRSREHLSREFAAGGAPNLKRVIDLLRTVCAADLLANPGYTVGDVTTILRFSSPSHLAAAARRIAGVAPGDLGGLGPRGVFTRFLKGRMRSRI